MQTHQYILKYLRQDNGGRFVGKFCIGAVLALLFFALTLSIHVPGAHASAYTTPCAKSDQRYTVVQGDTLSWIAYRYHTNWSNLASYGHIENPNLISIGQVVCIPGQGFSTATQVQQIHTAPYIVPVMYNNPSPAGNTGSIPGLITQVFGAYGPAAVNVARCESGFNPGAYNPSGASGLFQIMPATWAGTSQAGGSPYNAYANALAAHEIFVRDGYSWREWTCQPW